MYIQIKYEIFVCMYWKFVSFTNSGSNAKDLSYNAVSAGTKPAKNVHKNALLALFYKGINSTGLYPKSLKDVDTKDRIVVSMGCGVECPDIKIDYDFGLEDPKDKDFQYFLDLVEIIDKKIQDIIYF